jgi:DNA polymerase-3 subunit epsilon
VDFAAIDVETANPDRSSICQIGVAIFEHDLLTCEWGTYVNPEDNFFKQNISVHRITEQMVVGAPTFPSIIDNLLRVVGNRTVVCYTCFDRVAIHQAFAKYSIAPPQWPWIDCAQVARHAWEPTSQDGYALPDLCRAIGYNFKHHDALEDAKAAGKILVAAMSKLGTDLDGWTIDTPPTTRSTSNWIRFPKSVKRDGNPVGPLHGEVLVFTGSLKTPRADAARVAAELGCDIADGVTKKTTMLVVGDQDIRVLAGHEKSHKHRRAEELIAQGRSIHIVSESDFDALTRLTSGPSAATM